MSPGISKLVLWLWIVISPENSIWAYSDFEKDPGFCTKHNKVVYGKNSTSSNSRTIPPSLLSRTMGGGSL